MGGDQRRRFLLRRPAQLGHCDRLPVAVRLVEEGQELSQRERSDLRAHLLQRCEHCFSFLEGPTGRAVLLEVALPAARLTEEQSEAMFSAALRHGRGDPEERATDIALPASTESHPMLSVAPPEPVTLRRDYLDSLVSHLSPVAAGSATRDRALGGVLQVGSRSRMSGRQKSRDLPDEMHSGDLPAPAERDAHATATFGVNRPSLVPDVRRFHLRVVDGPGAGQSFESTGERTSIGSHPLNGVLLDERTVSRFHCELLVDDKGVWAKDLGSRNGTVLDGVLVKEAAVRNGSLLQLGRMGLRFELSGERTKLELSEHPRFGSLVGSSVAARMSFALMERAAASEVTVLLEGETGTGKSQAAESIHRQSSRRDHPFLVVDCGAMPPNLLESELF